MWGRRLPAWNPCMTSAARNHSRADRSAGRLDGPGFYALCQRQPLEAAFRLLDEVVATGGPTGTVPGGAVEWREAVRVASAMIGLDARSRQDPSLLDLCKAFTGACPRWAHGSRTGTALVAAIRLLRLLDAPASLFEWARSADARIPDLSVVQGERRAIERLLAIRCGYVVEVTHDNYDEDAYLLANPDVRNALEPGGMAAGFDHFRIFGHAERRTMRIFRTDRP